MKPTPILAAAVATLALGACSGDGDAPSTAPDAATSTPVPFGVTCGEADPAQQQYVAFRAVEAGAPRLKAELGVTDLGDRTYCVVPESYDSPATAARIVSYSVVLDQSDNYGERYGTFSRDGSDELLNFPFDFRVYGSCRTATAEIVVRGDGRDFTYRAVADVGPKCSD